jgi:hypothetical protein
MEKTPAADCFVGIDVSKSWVDVHVRPDGIAFRCDSDLQGLAELVQRLRRFDPRLIVLEASGGYESLPAVSLAEAGLPVAIVNPRQVRKFAEALGQLAKTDAIDARVIAHFAEAVRPPPRPMPDAAMTQLRELLAAAAPAPGHEPGREAAPGKSRKHNYPTLLQGHGEEPGGRARTHRSRHRQTHQSRPAVVR